MIIVAYQTHFLDLTLLLLLLAPNLPKHLQTAAESPQMMPCRSTDKQSPVRSLVGLDVQIRGGGEVL